MQVRTDPREVAVIHWGSEPPGWIVALAAACAQKSQRRVAQEIGYSPAVVNTVLKRCYAGDYGRVETAVRGRYLGHTVGCPVLGEIAADRCVAEQRREFAATNALRVRLWRACREGCPHSTVTKREGDQ